MDPAAVKGEFRPRGSVSAGATEPPPGEDAWVEVRDQLHVHDVAVWQAMRRAEVDRRVVGLVVHGVGEQPSGSTLKHVLGAFLPLIRAQIDPRAGVAITPVDDAGAAEGCIWFHRGDLEYELRMKEAWWAQCFEACTLSDFLAGAFQFGRTGITRDRKRPEEALLRVLAGPFARLRRPRSLVDVPLLLERAIVDAAAALMAAPLLLLLLGAWAVDAVGLRVLVPAWLTRPLLWLSNIVTRQLGDMSVYLRDPWNAARIRVRFEERLYQLIDEVALGTNGSGTRAVFIVAHSMGSVVAYEALTGSRMRQALDRAFRPRDRDDDPRPALHFFTVGSALNIAWDIAPKDEEPRFERALPASVRWVNVRARFDPVTLGPLQFPVDTLAFHAVRSTLLEDVEVVNQMDVFSDHTTYWNNAEEVIAPMMDRAFGGELGEELRLDPRARARRVAVLAWLKFAAWAIFPAVFFPVAFTGAGLWLAPRASTIFDALHIPLASWLDRHLLTPLIAAAIVALAVSLVYSTIVKWWWDGWDRRAKYRLGARRAPAATKDAASVPH